MFNLISYAQNFEDVILWRALGQVREGTYIDIGAQSPEEHSVSRLFYLKGWRGVHVEPAAYYAQALREARPDEQVIQAAVSDESGSLRFYDIPDTGLSTLEVDIAERHAQAGFHVSEVDVPAMTLDEVFECVAAQQVHWLKIDVEGAEHQVIAGWQSGHRPWILVIESTRPLSPEPSHDGWEPMVLAKGYTFAYFDGLNRFYVSDEHLELLSALACGPNVFDDFVLAPQSSFCAAANAVAAERHAQLHAELTQASMQAQELLDVADAQRAAESALERQVEMLSEAVEGYKEDLERAVLHGHALSGEIHRRDVELARQQALMQEILQSKSWRITHPLRVSLWYIGRAVRQPKVLARETLVRTMGAILARPRLGRSLNRAVRLVPFLHARLRLLASDRGIVAAHPEPVLVGGLGQVQYFGDESGVELLSLRARQFYERLSSASNNRKE
ncbi:FkbM family methyltransferase [Luteimonas sp. TWI1437]|uniref:FkbM family methyltransferase n=1 Tax=unclassified Luteimonas TaxID=2629088 RepID=UPI003209EF03